MQLAIAPGGAVVDVARGEVRRVHYKTGHGGLSCLVCGEKVSIRRSSAGFYHLYHPGGSEHDLLHGSAAETYEHWRLKLWVRDWLSGQGWNAVVEKSLDGVRPDVWAERTRACVCDRIAVEIQHSTLTADAAKQRTLRQRQAGYRTLWLTEDWSLVDLVPSVAIHSSLRANRYRQTLVGGRYYTVAYGRLGAEAGGLLVSGRRRPALETLLRDFSEREVIWMSHEVGFRGWATLQEWEAHLNQTTRLLRDRDKEVTDLQNHLRVERAEHRQLLTSMEDQIARLRDRTTAAEAEVHQTHEFIRIVEAQRVRAVEDATSARDAVFGGWRRRRRYRAALRGQPAIGVAAAG